MPAGGPHQPYNPNAAWRTADLLLHKWVLHVLAVLASGPTRRNELRRAVDSLVRADGERGLLDGEPGVHDSALTRILRQMETDGLIGRIVLDQHHPPAVLYSITAEGRSLLPLARALADWHHEHGAALAVRRAASHDDPTPTSDDVHP
jgi:DNA-binding HxlR family transcriptional regulator